MPEPNTTSSPTQISSAELSDELSTWNVGLGVLTLALFPLALPLLVLTVVFLLPLALPLVALVPLVLAWKLGWRAVRLAARGYATLRRQGDVTDERGSGRSDLRPGRGPGRLGGRLERGPA